MRTTTELVTPALAQQYLANQTQNRGISLPHVQNFEEAIRRGTFQESPQGISFDAFGRLRDGQHRLLALIRTKTAQTFRVHRDCSDGELSVLDHGRPRSVADSLRIFNGDKHAHNKVATARLAFNMGCGNVRMSDAVYQTMVEGLGVVNLEVVCSMTSRGKISAPGLLTLVYGRPIMGGQITATLQEKLRERDTVLKPDEANIFRDISRTAARNTTLEAMVRVLGEKLTLHHKPREAALRLMRGIQALIDGEPIRTLKVSNVGYDWITERREQLNLLSLPNMVPESLRGRRRTLSVENPPEEGQLVLRNTLEL